MKGGTGEGVASDNVCDECAHRLKLDERLPELLFGIVELRRRDCNEEQRRELEGKLREIGILDDLTGSYNLVHFRETLSQEIERGRRYNHQTSVLLIEVRDIADLKKADRDEVLITTVNFVKREVRLIDQVYRVADTRFTALLLQTPATGAQIAANRMKERSAEIALHSTISFSLQVGAIGWSPEDTPEVEDVLRQVQAS